MLVPQCTSRNDFAHYYVSSRAVLDGENPYTVSLADRYAELGMEFDERIPNATNPPALLWLFAPFSALPPAVGCAAWHALQFASLAVILLLTWRLTRDRLPLETLAIVAVVLLYCNPLYWHVYHSQVQLLLGAMVLGAYCWHTKGKHNAACAAIVVAGALKLFPLVLLPWFFWFTDETWQTRCKRAALAAGLGVLLFLVTGPALWSEFVNHAMAVVTSNAVNRTFNFGLPSLLGNLTYASYDFSPPESVVQLSRRIGIVAGLGLIALGYAFCFFGRQERERQFALLSLLMLAGSATMWGHYLVMLVFPATAAVIYVSRSGSLLPKAVVGASLLMIAMAGTGTAPQLAGFPIVNVLLHYLPLAAVLTLAMFFGRSLMGWFCRSVDMPLSNASTALEGDRT